MRACRPGGVVQYTNSLYFGPKQLVHPLRCRVEKDWEWVGKNMVGKFLNHNKLCAIRILLMLLKDAKN